PTIVRLLRGNGNAAILLCQFLYWTPRTPDAEGWFFNSQHKLKEQTGLAERAQLKARRFLVKNGYLEERRKGIPARIYSRLRLDKLADDLMKAGYSDSAHVKK